MYSDKGDKIIDLEEYKPVWVVSKNKCLVCKYKFVSVHTFDTDSSKLECPKCSKFKTLSILIATKK